MCVSYRRLNAVVKPFQFPISRCDDAITILRCSTVTIYIISLDACQGYHQITVRLSDQVFFTPDDLNYYFTVMLFEPTNAPGFYTATMKDFKTEWDTLFVIRITTLKSYEGQTITVTASQDILISVVKLVWESKTIIDNILLWCDKIKLILILFKCVCEVFKKYRGSFCMDKWEFLKKG